MAFLPFWDNHLFPALVICAADELPWKFIKRTLPLFNGALCNTMTILLQCNASMAIRKGDDNGLLQHLAWHFLRMI